MHQSEDSLLGGLELSPGGARALSLPLGSSRGEVTWSDMMWGFAQDSENASDDALPLHSSQNFFTLSCNSGLEPDDSRLGTPPSTWCPWKESSCPPPSWKVSSYQDVLKGGSTCEVVHALAQPRLM